MENKSNYPLLKPAYVLHTRPYRDTSLLIDFLTLTHGKVRAIARGVKRAKSPLKGILQPFVPLLITWVGRNELVTLTKAEAMGGLIRLGGGYLMAGLYLNELLVRLLQMHDAHQQLFYLYERTLHTLQRAGNINKALFHFECGLLEQLGYGLRFNQIAQTGELVKPDKFYSFHPQFGIAESIETTIKSNFLLGGKNLLAIHNNDLEDENVFFDAQRIMRLALDHLIGNRLIVSRALLKNVNL